MGKIIESNSGRFIKAYNILDQGLRDIYNLKSSLSFTDVIRKVATISSVIKKYEDDIVDYGRLRNAIIHRTTEEVIAEPHDDVVEKLESIVRLVTSPPLVLGCVGKREVFWADASLKLKELLVENYRTGFSNIPVYMKNTLMGVVNRKMIIDALGKAVLDKSPITKILDMPIIDVLEVLDINNHYEVVADKTTIDNVLYMFQQNRKLSTVIITHSGNYTEKPLGIVVTADIIDMQTILDNY